MIISDSSSLFTTSKISGPRMADASPRFPKVFLSGSKVRISSIACANGPINTKLIIPASSISGGTGGIPASSVKTPLRSSMSDTISKKLLIPSIYIVSTCAIKRPACSPLIASISSLVASPVRPMKALKNLTLNLSFMDSLTSSRSFAVMG